MSSKMKNTSNKTQKEFSEFLLKENKIDEKENKYSNLRSKKKKLKEPVKSQCEEKKPKELNELISSRLNPEVKVKTKGFWCKKLQNLEESFKKNKKCGLYDFNESDESDFCYEKKKKLKQKVKLLKRRQPAVSKCNKSGCKMGKVDKISKPEKKMKEIHRQSFCREQIILHKERKKLAEKGKKFTFSTGMPSLGITSTPAANKNNLVGASNFLFLSPIIKEDAKDCNSVNLNLPVNEKNIDNNLLIIGMGKETPKVKIKLKRISCRRVLRSGKVLNT